MKKNQQIAAAALSLALVISGGLFASNLRAADAKKGDGKKDDPIERVMKDYHKAPKGVDPLCKKASNGTATPEELKKLIAGYKELCAAKPPKGDEASWKEKTSKLYAASQALPKGGPDAIAKYKEALNCKACHSVHKPD